MESIGVFGGIAYLAFAILMIVSGWKIFEKAGKPGWACLIPIYNTLVLLEIVGKPWYWLLLMMIPGVGAIFAIWSINLLSKSFGYGTGFTLGLIFLSPIFYPILGLGDAKYNGPAGS
ncbi:DUF5684 domain-containing protein [Carboxylicivirga sp. N1Y90]|uniref:DUF5684 domain-containing protein n=1 Tax=Carboxylicivirga fragile TaxID=3417571 RepID=UPI003D3511CB|nr:hypothetical protein [Marinilabiliaceae bacterium N1Y90]